MVRIIERIHEDIHVVTYKMWMYRGRHRHMMRWIGHIMHIRTITRKISARIHANMRWESYLRSEIVRVIFQPLIILIIGFDFLFRHILNDFNIVLVSGAESVMAEIKDIF